MNVCIVFAWLLGVENAQIARIFDEIADLYDLTGGSEYRVRSYRAAARTVRDLSERIADRVERGHKLDELPNIGKSTAEKIVEILKTGTCRRLEELRDKVPPSLAEVMHVPGVGPKRAMKLHRALGIESVEELEQACRDEKVRDVEGFGETTEQNIIEGLATIRATSGRISLKEASEQAASLGRHLDSIKTIRRWEIAGSLRRGKETIGDLDILVHATDRKRAAEALIDHPGVAEIIQKGEEKTSVRLESGLQVDYRFFEPDEFGSALLYFTGSKAHNIAIRKLAVDRGWKLNEYGLSKDDRTLAGKTEEAVYHRLGLDWIPPELREDRGEVEAAAAGELPELITLDDLRGDLHSHTKVTDGADTLEDMVEAARDKGYQYLAVTEHTRALPMTKGLDAKRLGRHVERVRKLDEQLDDFWVMAGIEVDILDDGSLDLPPDALSELDWVVGSIHSAFEMEEEAMTDRLLTAIESGALDCIGHPMARLLGRRDPIRFNTDKVFAACAEHGVALEIDSQPDRLDLPDTHCQHARDAGVRFVITSDAHKANDFAFLKLGVATARRGWLTKQDVLNTKTAKQLDRYLGGHQ